MKQAFERIKEVTGCTTQVTLAEIFDIRQSSVSDAKRRNSIPSDWLLKLLRAKQVNPDWILDGESPKFLVPSETPTSPHVIRITEIRPPKECSSQELINELVRRALEKPDFEAIQKQVVGSWFPINKGENES